MRIEVQTSTEIIYQSRLSSFQEVVGVMWATAYQTRKNREDGCRQRTSHTRSRFRNSADATVLRISSSENCLQAELMMYCDKIRSRSTHTQISRRTLDEGSRCVWLMDWQRTAEQKREMCSTFASTDGLAGDLHTHPLIHTMTHAFHMMQICSIA